MNTSSRCLHGLGVLGLLVMVSAFPLDPTPGRVGTGLFARAETVGENPRSEDAGDQPSIESSTRIALPRMGPRHEGGILFLAEVGELPQGSLVGDCLLFPRPDPLTVGTEIPADAKQRVIVVYAAFPEGSPVELAGVTLGIEYSESITLGGYGYCHGDGVLLPTPDWPKSGSGIAMAFAPRPTESPVPVCWFVLSASAPGHIAVTPHPLPSHGGRFGNFDPVPWLEPVSGYGRLGFGGEEGEVPPLGIPEQLGVCCIDACFRLTARECAVYSGIYLGEGDCRGDPCAAETSSLGACCVPEGCVVSSQRDCYASGGRFLGAGMTCDPDPCESPR